jgi:AraC-like DNA-binding protein
LLSGDKRIHEIANEVGYENTNHFINLFKKETGLTPAAYRRTMSDRI